MSVIQYIDRDFSAPSRGIIERANAICSEYQGQGFDLTLRQLYYQFVARGLIPNKDSEYKRLGSIINDARLAGLLDWDYIVDRTRFLRAQSHWNTPASIIDSAAYSYRRDRWAKQQNRVEVWIEKDALVGVISGVCEHLDIPYFSCRGYTSQSEVWAAAQRLLSYRKNGQDPVIVHLGDHDPSGIDMTRDIKDRLDLFMGDGVAVRRIALNFEQVQTYNPPPNPTKLTDSRANGYMARFGDESWELDALEPTVIANLIRNEVAGIWDADAWTAEEAKEEKEKELLTTAAKRWGDIVNMLGRPS